MTRRLCLLPLSALVLVTGCLGAAPPVPKDEFHRIIVAEAAPAPSRVPVIGVISVAPFDADGLLRERPLVFATSDSGLSLRQHDYHHWVDVPSRMLHAQLVSFLRASGLARLVVTPDLRVTSEFEIRGRVKRLEQRLEDGRPMVTAALEFALVRLSDRHPLVIDSYSVELTSPDASVDASVATLNRAMSEIFGRFLQDARRSNLAATGS